MKGRKKVIAIVVAAVVVVAAVAVWAAKKDNGKSAPKPVMPTTTSMQKGDIEQRVTASGTVPAADEYSIFIELSQEVKEVFAEVGDYVEEGQLLVTYDIEDDKKELQNKVTSAQITLDKDVYKRQVYDNIASFNNACCFNGNIIRVRRAGSGYINKGLKFHFLSHLPF